jgi:hypothetical protein
MPHYDFYYNLVYVFGTKNPQYVYEISYVAKVYLGKLKPQFLINKNQTKQNDFL